MWGMQALEDSREKLQALRQSTQAALDSAMQHFLSSADKLPDNASEEGKMDNGEDSSTSAPPPVTCEYRRVLKKLHRMLRSSSRIPGE